MKFQWSIQSSHTQLIQSQVTYLICRNEHIWPLTHVFTIDWKLFIWLSFVILLIWEAMPWNFFFMKLWQLSLWLWHHTFQYIFAPPFPSQTSFRSKDFSALYPFWRMTFEELFLKKKTCEEIYRHKSMDVSRSSKTIDQSFMTNLKIYLQQSNIDSRCRLHLKNANT